MSRVEIRAGVRFLVVRLEEFFADPARRQSDELCVGSGWVSTADVTAEYTVYWIEATGDLYALRHPEVAFGPGAPKPFGVYLPRFSKESAELDVEHLGRADRSTLEEILATTDASPKEERSLEWLRQRAGD